MSATASVPILLFAAPSGGGAVLALTIAALPALEHAEVDLSATGFALILLYAALNLDIVAVDRITVARILLQLPQTHQSQHLVLSLPQILSLLLATLV